MEQIIRIAEFIFNSFIHIWPYLLITIPLSVFVKVSGASKFISRALNRKPLLSIFLATVIGAFSPFCSCGVIPVIASLLIGGVPLAPVMSFWIASPSMDPEIFFLSAATIGWKLSIWRLSATFIISLLSGYITHLAWQKNLLGVNILRENDYSLTRHLLRPVSSLLSGWRNHIVTLMRKPGKISVRLIARDINNNQSTVNCCISAEELHVAPESVTESCEKADCNIDKEGRTKTVSFQKRLLNETWKASLMVLKFMTLAFLITAIIQFYIPQEYISKLMVHEGGYSVIIASLIGIPVYTSNITALPLINGLLELGMNKGAALAFLIAGPTTTLPAMAAVRGLVNRRIFLLYISFSLIGSIISGLLFNLID